ncbi:MAG: glycosyltransferase [Desulfovibrio sp.]|nr:glycosyltransferase [Desulfovibrio sp.]
MQILLLNCDLPSLPGHTLYHIKAPQGGVVSIRKLLKRQSEFPEHLAFDLFLQQERLGSRVIVRDLTALPCPKIFWSIDSHLNLFWQHWYCQLFDLVLTPHPSLFRKLPKEWAPTALQGFTFPGCARSFRSHRERPRDAVFVGVIDKHREQRQRFASFLRTRFGICAQKMPYGQMLDLYETSRLLPNESICREFNFRIMEGASCGCCVLTEAIGEDLEANFTVDKEVLTYRHARELSELFTFLQSRPNLSEKIGHAAWQRVQKEHLPEQRWQRLDQLGQKLTAKALDGQSCERFALLSAIQAARGDGTDAKTLTQLTELLKTLDPHPDVLAMRLRLACEANDWENLHKQLCDLQQQAFSRKEACPLDLAIAAYCASLRLNEETLLHTAQDLLSAHLNQQQDLAQQPFPLALAELLIRNKRICQPGFRFDPSRHCPETALELLLMLETRASQEQKRLLHEKLAELSHVIPFISLNKRYCQRWAEEQPDSWSAAFDASLRSFEAFCPEEGQHYLQTAQKLAKAQGQEEALAQALAHVGLSKS